MIEIPTTTAIVLIALMLFTIAVLWLVGRWPR